MAVSTSGVLFSSTLPVALSRLTGSSSVHITSSSQLSFFSPEVATVEKLCLSPDGLHSSSDWPTRIRLSCICLAVPWL